MVKDYYHVLGVSVEAETGEIKKAYRLLAKICHPDVRPGEDHPEAQEQFKEITEAYEVLIDPARRKKYDQMSRMRWKTPGTAGRGPGVRRDAAVEWTASSTDAESDPAGAPIVEPVPAPKAKRTASPKASPKRSRRRKPEPVRAVASKPRPKRAARKKPGVGRAGSPKPERKRAEPVAAQAAEPIRPAARPPRPQPPVESRSRTTAIPRGGASRERAAPRDPRRFDPPGSPENGGGASAAPGTRIVEVALSFEMAVKGGVQMTTVPMEERCEKCGGTGAKSKRGISTCPGCEGRGTLPGGAGSPATDVARCPRCDGRGTLVRERCTRCQGSGWSRKDRKIAIRVEPGETDGARHRLRDVMEPMAGVDPGAIEVEFRVREHPFFRRRGLDIVCEAPIELRTAIRGGEVTVRTALGKRVVIKVPPGTDGGTTFRIPGEGIRKDGGTGNQLVTVKIVMPKGLSDKAGEYLDLFLNETRR